MLENLGEHILYLDPLSTTFLIFLRKSEHDGLGEEKS